MKISKNSHKRMAVVVRDSRSQEEEQVSKTIGQILPLDKKLEDYVKTRIQETKFPYKILGVSADLKSDTQMSRMVIHYFNNFVNEILRTRLNDKQESAVREINYTNYLQNISPNIKLVNKKRKKIKISDINLHISDQFVHELVTLHLRGRLKKNVLTESENKVVYIPDTIEKLVLAVCGEKDFMECIMKIPADELQVCLNAVFEDYAKWIMEIVRSVENQEVKVQVYGEKEHCCLKLANAESKKKKYIFEFMEEYACGTKESREEMLRSIRRLILLFFCGESVYGEVEKKNISIWNFDFLQKLSSDIPKVFDSECERLLLEREQLECLPKDNITDDIKQKKRKIDREVKIRIRQEIIQKYRHANNVLISQMQKNGNTEIEQEAYKKQRFWLEHIEHDAEKLLLPDQNKTINQSKLYTEWLCETIWKRWISFIASKFVDQGKAVYHFAMPDLRKINDGQAVKIGNVQRQFQNGITSFDYERITAEERLERSFISAILFAVNNYASAVCSESVYEKNGNVEDVLQFDPQKLIDSSSQDAGWRLMQYFGGLSQWEESSIAEYIKSDTGKSALILDVQKALARIRNVSFHYTASLDTEKLSEESVLVELFQKEREGLSKLLRKKYFSNNIPMFYSVEDINVLMDAMYVKEKVLESQIPSFQNVFGLNDMYKNIKNFIDQKAYIELQKDTDVVKIFHHAFYFLLKEFYYNRFLQENNLKIRFIEALSEKKKEETDKKRRMAIENLEARLDDYEKQKQGMEFGELCQCILTDYNLQNSQKKVRSNRNDDLLAEKKYEHFWMLLLECMKTAFIKYVKFDMIESNKECGFLRKPQFRDIAKIEEKEFCNGWKTEIYEDLEAYKYNAWSISWFITGHFITPDQLNQLKGEIKCYLNYVRGIEDRRYAAMGIKFPLKKEKEEQYIKLLKVLNLVSEYCGKVSAKWNDYYKNEYEFAQNIRQYLAYDRENPDMDPLIQLYNFCNQKAADSPSEYIGIFYNGKEPVPNRNVIRARMYGTEKLIARCLLDDRVTEQEILEHYEFAKKLDYVFKSGQCKDINQEKNRRRYQQQKNRIELVDILKYSKILNDLISQLISWCYLRERDRMYFQIGFHYIRLHFGKDIVDSSSKFRVLKEKDAIHGKGINIVDGAILYQLAAIYTYNLAVYRLDKSGEAKVSKGAPAGSQTANGVNSFCKEYCEEEWKNNRDVSVYEAGLELFENAHEERELINFRNYIDHFKYFARRDISIIELYSKVFAMFFRHDTKLKKSVTVILQNILARHFALASIELSYKTPQIKIKSLNSEVTVHKYEVKGKNGKVKKFTEKIDYYDQRFLERLQKLLEYHNG